MKIPAELLSAFPPSVNSLVDYSRQFVDDHMLMEIARADYGIDADESFRMLKKIRDTGSKPNVRDWWPKEVLELTRWKEPSELEEYEQPAPVHRSKHRGAKVNVAVSPRIRGHRLRLFACAILLWFPESDITVESTLAQGLESARYVGAEANGAFGRLLTATEDEYLYGERWYLALSLFVLAIRLQSSVDGHFLRSVTDWVLDEESAFSGLRPPSHSGEWPPVPFGFGRGYWNPLFNEMLEFAKSVQSEDLREKIILIAQSSFQ